MTLLSVFAHSKRRFSIAAATLALTVLTSSIASAQDSDTSPAPMFGAGTRPIVTLNFASANRFKEKAEFLFETAGTPEALENIMETLEENVNGLEGVNWDRPGGVMIFLNSVLPPSFEFVAYVPISSVEEFQAMVELGPVIMQKDSSEEGRYELIGPRRTTPVRIEGNYAFLQLPPMEPDPAFERDLPSPLNLVGGLSNEFDVSLSFDVDAVPKPTRDLLYNMLVSFISTQHQQRDEEPDAVYAVREAWQQRDIAAIKMFFQDAKRFTLGIGLSEEEACANLDMVMEARDASDMLEEMFLSISKPSYFGAIASDEAPVSVLYATTMAERDASALADVFEAAKGWLAFQIAEKDEFGDVPQDGSPLFQALTALSETARARQFDLFTQLYQDSSDKLAVVGAIRVEDGEAIANGLQDALTRLQGIEALGDMEIAAKEHAGMTFHRIGFKNPPSEAIDIFGNGPGVTLGVGGRSAWFVVGGEDGFDVLSGVIDQLADSYANPSELQQIASGRVIVNVGQLRTIFEGSGKNRANTEEQNKDEEEKAVAAAPAAGNGRSGRNARGGRGEQQRRRQASAALFAEALAEGQDRIEVSIRPTDQGIRVRAKLDTGFIRGAGRFMNSMMGGND